MTSQDSPNAPEYVTDSVATRAGGRVALVTGGSRGIGRAIAAELGRAGIAVVLTYRNDRASADAAVRELRQYGPGVVATRCDVGVAAADAVETAISEFGRLDVIVSNAGTASTGNTVETTTREDLEQALAIHAVGPHQLCRAALPYLRQHERSDVVFISSAATRVFRPGGGTYNMGKAALEALAHTLAREERAHGVHVNIVAPGIVDTDMGRRALRRQGLDETRAATTAPFGRLCAPTDIARLVAFLVSEHGAYVNDQRIVMDGGTFVSSLPDEGDAGR